MIKKLTLLFFLAFALFTLAACATSVALEEETKTQTPAETAENLSEIESLDDTEDMSEENDNPLLVAADIMLITDGDALENDTLSAGAWKGIQRFADVNDVTCSYALAEETTPEAYLAAIQSAAEQGASIIVCPGSRLAQAVYEAQALYSDISFILLNGEPHSADYSETQIGANTCAVSFAEEQAGYLAGYAAVKEGYRKLGFMGGLATPEVVAYGCGFLQGANQAAIDLDVNIEVRYTYTGCISEAANIQTWAGSWLANGTELIFACAENANLSIIAAAESAGAAVIGANVDQSSLSSSVIFSAMKDAEAAVYHILLQYAQGTFPGGKNVRMDVSTGSVGLSFDAARLHTLTEDAYIILYLSLSRGDMTAERVTDSLADLSVYAGEKMQLTVE